MLIAVATDDGTHIAQHFGRCAFFSIWQCKEGEEPRNLGLRQNTFTAHGTGGEVPPADLPSAPRPGEIEGEPVTGKVQGELERATHSRVLEGLADVQVVIAAGMGRRMVNDFTATAKEVFITDRYDVSGAVEQYVQGKLETGEPCEGQ
jgi:predicted Fe-Mo cluster-binding NifX family protein